MPGRALVVGAVVGDIRGVENDVRDVAKFLAGLGFTVTTLDPRTGATRDAILAGYHQLIDDVAPGTDEPVVLYYAGHGGEVINAEHDDQGPALPRVFKCIIPIDYEAGSETDFRGITSFELSALQDRLTQKTRNVTVILDCCFSGQMSRAMRPTAGPASELTPRALVAPTQQAMRLHLDVLRARYPDLFSRPDTGNPTAVRAVACGESQSAWPIRDAAGEWHGVFTQALLATLGEVGGAPVTWEALGKAITARVQSSYPDQRPRIEGPQRRRVFSLDEGEATISVAVRREPCS